jgi:hypothetical protein
VLGGSDGLILDHLRSFDRWMAAVTPRVGPPSVALLLALFSGSCWLSFNRWEAESRGWRTLPSRRAPCQRRPGGTVGPLHGCPKPRRSCPPTHPRRSFRRAPALSARPPAPRVKRGSPQGPPSPIGGVILCFLWNIAPRSPDVCAGRRGHLRKSFRIPRGSLWETQVPRRTV